MLEFSRTQLNPRLIDGDIGAAFADFAFEALEEQLPGLRRFPTGGKDGAIDFSATTSASRTVVECKHVGDGGIVQVRARWREVAGRLERNLADAAGPASGQSQYGPWYRREPGIGSYVFSVSARLAHQDHVDELAHEIRAFFDELARTRPHLAHLEGMTVRVVDFGELLDMTKRRAHVLYRWFPATRPIGLMPLEEPFGGAGFRDYLSSDRLPHYTLHHHRERAPLPEGVEIEDEGELLGVLEHRTTGLLITGAGGLGKTRLTTEIGQLARQRDWTVLRALPSTRRSSIEQLAETVKPGERTLLLFDYIEVLRDFQDLVGLLNDLNDQYDLNVRYIANCRRSYYNQVAPLPRHHRVNLSPVAGEAHAEWYAEYQRAVVDHILRHSGLEIRPEHVHVCRQIPVLAVFLAYLHDAGRETELSELLDEQDFSSWVLKRVRLSVGRPVDRELAQLMMLFPFEEDMRLSPELQALLDVLAADGWIERLPDETGRGALWVSAHDVLADQIVVSHLDRVAMTARRFIDEALTCGEQLDQLRSVLASLQRVVDAPALASLDWPELFGEHIAAAPERWRAARDWLLETALLTHEQQIGLLAAHPWLWEGAEHEVDFQNRVGYLSRWVLELERREHQTFEQRATIESWAVRAAGQAESVNYVITWGLRLTPDGVRDSALRWIEAHPLEFQTHYLLVGWLKAGLPAVEVASYVREWAERYADARACGFVFRAWLDADGDREIVRGPLEQWLTTHSEWEEARFAFCAWLWADGEHAVVEQSIERWLARHPLSAHTPFVCVALLRTGADPAPLESVVSRWLSMRDDPLRARLLVEAWLYAGGEPEVVREPLGHWLASAGAEPGAGPVYAAWLAASSDVEPIGEPLAAWLELHATEENVLAVFEAWLGGGHATVGVQSALARWLAVHAELVAASFLYRAWLDARGDRATVREPIARWLAQHAQDAEADYVYRGWIRAGGELELIAAPMERWLSAHGGEHDADFAYCTYLRGGGDVEVVRTPLMPWLEQHGADEHASFVLGAWLDAGGEPTAVQDAVQRWLEVHGSSETGSFVFQGWLRAGGDPELVRAALVRWLPDHEQHEDARFAVQEWLEAGGEPEVVRAAVECWLAEHSEHESASFTLRAWLEADGDPVVVRDGVRRWLEAYGSSETGSFVLQAWLRAGGDPDAVQAALFAWLDACGAEDNASYVIQAALEANVPANALQPALTRWLPAHPEGVGRRYLLHAWLVAGGDLDPVRAPTLAWLEEHAESDDARYLLQAWLERDGDPAEVREPIERWLRLHGESQAASFLLQPWLDAGADPAAIGVTVKRWLELHASAEGATFVFQAWLRAGGDPDAVEEALLAWLAAHPDSEASRYPLHAWLTAGGRLDLVRASMLSWLGHYGTHEQAGYMLRDWLRAGGDPDAVRATLVSWLAAHGAAEHTRFVLQTWLDADGGVETVRAAVERWLELHSEAASATFVLQAWLRAGGDPDAVEDAVHRWLPAHGGGEAGSFVLQRWLLDGGEPAAMEAVVRRWLTANVAWLGARYVMTAWLRAGGDASVVRPAAFEWLQLHRTHVEALYVAGEVIRVDRAALSPEVFEAIVETCRLHPAHASALWCLNRLAPVLPTPAHSDPLLAASEAVLGRLTRNGDVRPGVASLATQLLVRLVRAPELQDQRARARVNALVLVWLRYHAAYPPAASIPRFVQHRAYFVRFVDLVQTGEIDYALDDRAAVERFLRWVDGWLPDQKETLAAPLRSLQRTHPAPGLWELLQHA